MFSFGEENTSNLLKVVLYLTTFIFGRFININGLFLTPDFESDWRTIHGSSNTTLTKFTVSHGIGETPLLVDVQVKVISGVNDGYIFQAAGHKIREDDQPDGFGGVVYQYDSNDVFVYAPVQNNGFQGRVVYTATSPYWEGPTSEDTLIGEVKVRAWRASSLPTPDYTASGITIVSQSNNSDEYYVSRSHGLGEYPVLVICRTVFSNGKVSDSMGSTLIYYVGTPYDHNGYVVCGFSDSEIRVWVPTDEKGYLFKGLDGYDVSGEYSEGTFEIFAWTNSSLSPNRTGTHALGPSVRGSDLQQNVSSVGSVNMTFTRAWVQADSGLNAGFRFAGTGALVTEDQVRATPCSYGALVYGFTESVFRYWQPGDGDGTSNGALVCIADSMSNGTNNQATSTGMVVHNTWSLDVDECASGVCQNGAGCTNYAWGYLCTCSPGWTGTTCNTATCNNKLDDYTSDCARGWPGTNCETDINECNSTPCLNGATCNNNVNNYTCTCDGGWTGTNCETDINECNSIPCLNGATCNNNVNNYTCTCDGGWTGTNCETDINECNSIPCLNGATCNNNVNNYTCTCDGGWTGTNCETYINECDSTPCLNGATCNNNINNYTCTCDGGWTGANCETATCNNKLDDYTSDCARGWPGTNCETDINECNSTPCLNGATCNNNVNNYTCTCDGGWTGTNCETDINECNSIPCLNGATCNNNVNNYTCTCDGGWTGTNCETDINECNSIPCLNGATCNNNVNNYTCTCDGGWTGTNCETYINECDSTPCLNGATCNNNINNYTCTCDGGWTGANCETATCNNKLDDYTSDCARGWPGTNCETDINECNSTPCLNGATCNNNVNNYTCTCDGGWTGTNCETDINECNSIPCLNGATCNNKVNNYTCTCDGGWTGTNCETYINECDSTPCLNGATCNNNINNYTCTCDGGWTGANCETDIDECFSSPCQNEAACNDAVNYYTCTCVGAWTGIHCSIENSAPTTVTRSIIGLLSIKSIILILCSQ